MRYFLSFFLIIGLCWLGIYAFQHSSTITIAYQWNNSLWEAEFSSTTLLIAGLLGVFGLLLCFTLIKYLLDLNKRFNNRHIERFSLAAKKDLTKGLINFTEGHWGKSEDLLMSKVDYSETPLLNYLAASRAAHMQQAYDRRDEYLQRASRQGNGAQLAVAVSQAEMQFTSNQLEQSRATLIRLLEDSPKHPYALKLLAKVYFQQEDWNNLFALLPDLKNLSLVDDSDNRKYQNTAITGIFQSLSEKKDIPNINALWQQLPENIQEDPEYLLLYCRALSVSGENEKSDKLLFDKLSNSPNEKLFERYGLIEHKSTEEAIKQAEEWLIDNDKSPMLLLSLARLYRSSELWGKSKSYYNQSLNFSPSSPVYLEFAELLEELSEHENAEICYKQGLNYSIYNKGEILNIKALRSIDISNKNPQKNSA